MSNIKLCKKGIHIKKENKGKFTSYCGGKVTQECIDKAKKSGNKKLVKRAVFAENARKWKEGGKIRKMQLAGPINLANSRRNTGNTSFYKKGIDKTFNIIKKIGKWMNEAYTTTALDEYGKPIMQANGELMTRTSTPARDFAAISAFAGTPLQFSALPLLKTVGTVISIPDAISDFTTVAHDNSIENIGHAFTNFPLVKALKSKGMLDDVWAGVGKLDDAISSVSPINNKSK